MENNNKREHTYFAPSERDSPEDIINQKNSIEAAEFLDRILAKTPFMFLIINDKRQVVYSNHLLAENLGYKSMDETLGFRHGEIFGCINSGIETGGCGTSKNCRYCGAVESILESQKRNELVTRETTMIMNLNGRNEPGNFQVSSRPFDWKGKSYFIVTLEDISAGKRKEQLERTFFHDIKNKAGTVSGFLQLIKMRKEDSRNDWYFELAERGITELLEDIDYQRQLLQAENGKLELKFTDVSMHKTIINVCEDFQGMAKTYELSIKTDISEPDAMIKSDSVLLRRILGNMLKNAIEASKKDDMVIAGFHRKNNSVVFQIKNPGYIPEEIQSRIFNRSFSTKGDGRGIGTYSIKLFTEEYLGGKVYFSSFPQQGTTFNIELPGDEDNN